MLSNDGGSRLMPKEGGSSERVGSEERPNLARMYDYLLGGSRNFAADRELADRMISLSPRVATGARANRACLARMVRHCVVDLGVTQFLDLGSGIPTTGAVHEIAHALAPGARIAYVDHDPVVVAYARDLLVDEPTITVTHADLRDPLAVLSAPGVAGLLDLEKPVAVLALAVLHFVADADDPAGLVAYYRSALASGSALGLTHVALDTDECDAVCAATDLYSCSTSTSHPRTRSQIASLLREFDLVSPGLVDIGDWRPDSPRWAPGASVFGYAALGVRRAADARGA